MPRLGYLSPVRRALFVLNRLMACLKLNEVLDISVRRFVCSLARR